MEYLGEKIIRLQDAKFKLVNNNNNETSIFIAGELAEKLNLVDNTRAKFIIEKSDIIKLLCFTFSFKEVIYKKEIISLDLDWFEKYLKLINRHFEKSNEFYFDVSKQTQDRVYFKAIGQESGLNIRDLFIQDHIKLKFYRNDNNIINVECSNEKYSEINQVTDIDFIEDLILRQFALKAINFLVNKYGEEFFKSKITTISESITSDNIEYKTFLLSDYFKQGLLYSFINEPIKNDSRTSPRYINQNLNILGEKYIYLTTEWAYTGTSNLLFSQLVKFIEEYSNNEYSALKKEDGTYVLILKKIEIQSEFNIDIFENNCLDIGLSFSNKLIVRFVSSLLTKPFVILTGLSGSGKTKLAQAFAIWISESDRQYKIVPVGSDWTNREPLLGYPNGLEVSSYVTPDSGALEIILEASKEENIDKPYFLILDEMNLSHVERYFADFLSIMESKDCIKLYTGNIRKDSSDIEMPKELNWPKNLFVIGTVNIDETTYMFSPKVLDRANVIEFRISEKEMENFLNEERDHIEVKDIASLGKSMGSSFLQLSNDKQITKTPESKVLNDFFSALQEVGAEFGYRSANEIELLITKLGQITDDLDLTINEKIDIAIMQKLLPKIHGSRKKLIAPLETLAGFCIDNIDKELSIEEKRLAVQQYFTERTLQETIEIIYPISFEKIARMYKNAIDNGFTSYAEA